MASLSKKQAEEALELRKDGKTYREIEEKLVEKYGRDNVPRHTTINNNLRPVVKGEKDLEQVFEERNEKKARKKKKSKKKTEESKTEIEKDLEDDLDVKSQTDEKENKTRWMAKSGVFIFLIILGLILLIYYLIFP